MRVRQVENYPDYFVVEDGRVFSCKSDRDIIVLKPRPVGRDGYRQVVLYREGKKCAKYIHRLIIEAFRGPCPNGCECMHIDDNLANNRLENLMWGTHSQNMIQSVRNGTHVSNQLKGIPLTKERKRNISEGQKRAWARKKGFESSSR